MQLIGIREVNGVNTLAPEQKMGFELDGLTVVFGYNGSGKSGYARILRAVCHARHRGNLILPDAFAKGQPPVPSATVDFREGGADCTLQWEQGQALQSPLQQISFFDAECASVHVDDANELAFTPFGLDVMPKLVSVCQNVQGKVQEMINEQERAKPASLAEPQAAEGTEVRQAIDQITKDSDIEQFRELSKLAEEDFGRLKELQAMLATDPVGRARELKNMMQRLGRLRTQTQAALDALSEEAVGALQSLYEDAHTKKQAAQTAANDAFSDQPLTGVGEKVAPTCEKFIIVDFRIADTFTDSLVKLDVPNRAVHGSRLSKRPGWRKCVVDPCVSGSGRTNGLLRNQSCFSPKGTRSWLWPRRCPASHWRTSLPLTAKER